MKLRWERCILLACVLAVASCGGGSSSDSSNAPVNDVKHPAVTNYTNRQIDVYYTSVADKAVIFLHGGGGTNHGAAYELGLISSNATPTDSSVNWDWLNNNQVIAVFPQGDAATPGGPPTWNNYVMDSGQDDAAFLRALAQYIKDQYGVSKIYLAGHSNGGMMVNRLWCEQQASDLFDAYISFAGPASDHFLTTPCAPSVAKPYYGVAGSSDSILQVATYGWKGAEWVINEQSPYIAFNGTSIIDPNLIGEYQQQATRINLLCPGDTLSATGSTSGNLVTWTNCGGRLELQEVLGADHWLYSLPGGDTEVSDSLSARAGSSRTVLLDMAAQFISALGG
jgi:poly(3-hydroxybutyrate) depolymerase